MKHYQLQSLAVLLIILLHSCSSQTRDGHEKATAATAIPVFEDVDPGVKNQVNDFLTGYFALNHALIEDSLEEARVAATELLGTTMKFDKSVLSGEQMDFYLVQGSNLKDGLQDISGSDDIEKARAGLATVSEAMYSLVKAFHPNESTLYYQYCPMARNNQGANWLSATEELVNPYMGQMMLRCGRTQEKLE